VSSAEPQPSNAQILLVDDEEQFLQTLSRRLKERGLSVDAVTSGDDAVKTIKSRNFDAIILDLVMPGTGGIETMRRIRKENPDIQVIILTGYPSKEKISEAMSEGALEFLEKPADIDMLLDKIAEARDKKTLWLLWRNLRT